jgi:hypothetical protein
MNKSLGCAILIAFFIASIAVSPTLSGLLYITERVKERNGKL